MLKTPSGLTTSSMPSSASRSAVRNSGVPGSACFSATGTVACSQFRAVQAVEPNSERVPAPYWPSFPDIVRVNDGTPVIVDCGIEQGFKLTPAALQAAITPRTRWLVLNTPGNPSGAVYSREELAALAQVLRLHPQVLVLLDELYEHIWFTPQAPAHWLAVAPDLRERTLLVNGVSKTYAMTGWRIGYGAGPRELIGAMAKLQSQSTSNPCSVSQYAALAALQGPQDYVAESRAVFQRRRDLVVAGLNACPGIECPVPEGAFYVYPSIKALIGKTSAGGTPITDDEAFATALLDETGVAVVFGAAFGLSPHFRISYATADAVLDDACARIKGFCEGLR